MALLRGHDNIDTRLTSVERQFRFLQQELRSLQLHCKILKEMHTEKCSLSLVDGLTNLLGVIECVHKADKPIVHWYNSSRGAKTALGLIGMRERTQKTLNETTAQLQAQLFILEEKFKDTSHVFMSSLQSMDTLNQRVTEFSSESVGATLREVHVACAEYAELLAVLGEEIKEIEEVGDAVNKELGTARSDLQQTRSSRQAAETDGEKYKTVCTYISRRKVTKFYSEGRSVLWDQSRPEHLDSRWPALEWEF
jgi:hypothetical protein